MKVLFVSSGNKSSEISPIVFAQGESLKSIGVDVDYFTIKGKGVWGYIKASFNLRKRLKQVKYSIVHAHYSLSGFSAALAFPPRLIVSLMGSDAYRKGLNKLVIRFFYKYLWGKTILKTVEMRRELGLKNGVVLPNGVDINVFKPQNKQEARKKVSFPENKKIAVFIADPSRSEKNYKFALEAVELIADENLALIPVYEVKHSEIVDYLNAADALVLTSLWEGSVNVVKEAMACNVPVVSTRVGDVLENTSGVYGYFIAESNSNDFAQKLREALCLNGEVKGRERLVEIGLDSESISHKLKHLYDSILNG